MTHLASFVDKTAWAAKLAEQNCEEVLTSPLSVPGTISVSTTPQNGGSEKHKSHKGLDNLCCDIKPNTSSQEHSNQSR